MKNQIAENRFKNLAHPKVLELCKVFGGLLFNLFCKITKRKYVIGIDKGSPEGDCTAYGYYDDKQVLHIYKVINLTSGLYI
jgi:hypothetical protein